MVGSICFLAHIHVGIAAVDFGDVLVWKSKAIKAETNFPLRSYFFSSFLPPNFPIDDLFSGLHSLCYFFFKKAFFLRISGFISPKGKLAKNLSRDHTVLKKFYSNAIFSRGPVL